MKIFENYTGNAMLNNALMTIEALGNLSDVSEITPNVLQRIYQNVELPEINQRLKSYTMVFSLNNPLVNPAKKTNNAGERTYRRLMSSIMGTFENEGIFICEISGLKFQKTFEEYYSDDLEEQKQLAKNEITDSKLLKKELDKIDKTDISLNRTWFPLIGGLGSDAQALPQAKHAIRIHPICIVILQFLPLSAVLYKGGILLVDSSNFSLAREMIFENVKTVKEKIQHHSSDKAVENIRDFNKGSYLLRALNILSEKEQYEESYSDLNLWSFSNSGTGASCEIDRVPNQLIRKLQLFRKNVESSDELTEVLASDRVYRFLESLEDNKEWFGLYPAVYGSGKKRVEYEGMTPQFLEVYFKAIQSQKSLDYGKYIAGLIEKYKNKNIEKLLSKTDGWNEADFKVEVYKILVRAAEENEWSLEHQIEILDDPDILPIRNSFRRLQRLIHFFYYKKSFTATLPSPLSKSTAAWEAAQLLIEIIQKGQDHRRLISRLLNPNETYHVSFERVVFDAVGRIDLKLENLIEMFYDEQFRFLKYGIIDLLRIFFSQKEQQNYPAQLWESYLQSTPNFQEWKNRLAAFADDYKTYYFDRYQNKEASVMPYKKFARVISSFIDPKINFTRLLQEAIENTNQFLIEERVEKTDRWTIEDLLTDPSGERSQNMSKFALRFIMRAQVNKLHQQSIIQNK